MSCQLVVRVNDETVAATSTSARVWLHNICNELSRTRAVRNVDTRRRPHFHSMNIG